ncbi:MAG: hypothetical protein IJQ67_07025 [Bacilli bacterium]|nr:hypothetical protein [Bacilli bacterium]
MAKPSVTTIKKYLVALTKKKVKYMTSERLARIVGVYPEKINEDLSYFDPMVNIDYTYNLLDLVPQMREYVLNDENKKNQRVVKDVVTKKQLAQYDSVVDFVYKKMTIPGSGLVNPNVELSDADLRALKRLIQEEQDRRKKK